MSRAELGFAIDSSGAKSAAVDLDNLVSAAQRAEKAEQGLGRASQQAQSGIRSLSAAVRQLTEAEGRMGAGFAQKRAQDIAAYGQELDRLRAKFNPVFAASKQYETSLNELNRAHRVGAVTTREYEDALERLNLEFAAIQTGARGANTALGAMRLSMGQTRMMSKQLMFQLVDIGQAIPLAFQSPVFALQNLGFQMAQIGQLYAGQGGMRAALRDSIQMVGRFAARVGPAAVVVGALTLGFGGLVSEINEVSEVTVTWGDTAKAIIQLVGEAVYDFLEPAINAIAPWFQAAWELVRTYTKEAGNFIINAIRVAIDAVGTAIGTVPDLFETAWEGAKSAVLYSLADMTGALQQFLQLAADGFNEVFGTNLGAPTALRDLTTELNRRGSDALEAAKAATGRVGQAGADFMGRASETFASDPLGDAFSAISARAQENARSRLAGETGGGGGGESATDREAERRAREAERLREAYESMVASGQEFIAQQEIEQQALGMSREAANRLRIEFDFLNEAARAGIELTPEQAARLRELAGAMAAAEERTRRMSEAQRDQQELTDHLRGSTVGFLEDLRGGLENGESAWASFADAAVNALDSIINKVIELIAAQQSSGTSGGGGGLFGSIASGLLSIGTSLFGGGGGVTTQASTTAALGQNSGIFGAGGGIRLPFADGGVINHGNVVPFANGGIVNEPTTFGMANGRTGLMGERGPESIMPLAKMSDGKLGVHAKGSGGQPVKIEQTNVFQGTQNADEVRRVVEENNKKLMREMQKQRRLDGDFMGVA